MPSIELVNQQRKIKINRKTLVDFSKAAVESIAEAKNKSLAVAFVSDKKMRALNRSFRGKDATTDVLSFPYETEDFKPNAEASLETAEYLGDIAISLEQAERQSADNDLNFEIELKQLILHGILHLCGFDHETDDGKMNRRELELRDKLQIL